MLNSRKATLVALTALTLTSIGCGTTGVATAPSAAGLKAAGNTMVVQGISRKLGYDVDRYTTVLAKKAKPVKMPRQGLLPSSANLSEFQAPVYDQGKLGSCTAFAMAKGMRESMQRKNKERVEPLSGLFQYYETRARLGSIGEDSGGTITDGMFVLKEVGAAPDATWAYDIAKFTVKPPAASYAAASEFKVDTITQLSGLDDVKASLAAGNSVAFGFIVYKNFMKIGADGMMPMPAAGEQRMGGHAVLAIGYDDAKKALIVRNSWSEKWGDKGNFYMPYAFVNSGKCMDFWTAK